MTRVAPEEPGSPTASDTAGAPPSQPARALVAATDPDLGAQLQRDLEAVGYVVARPVPGTPPEDSAPVSVVLVAPEADGPERRFAEQVRRSPTFARVPIVWVARPEGGELARAEHLYDDFLDLPYTRASLAARLGLARRRLGHPGGEVLRRGSLALNLSSFQASIDERPIELTYMEYQLLRFLAASAGRVQTRQAILHHVWGYDYYGGIRTVDVHVRRLRAKLDEHAWMIETVRSVGYRFTQSPGGD